MIHAPAARAKNIRSAMENESIKLRKYGCDHQKSDPFFILYFALESSLGETVVSPQIKRLTLLKKKEIIFRRIFRQLQRRGIRGSPLIGGERSEERRVGKESRYRWSPY